MKILDLFAGIGGIRLGFEQAFGRDNLQCVFSSEINAHAIKTYQANFPNSRIEGDITKINAKDIPDHDILLKDFLANHFRKQDLKKDSLMCFDLDFLISNAY